jgi:hypothetical protein
VSGRSGWSSRFRAVGVGVLGIAVGVGFGGVLGVVFGTLGGCAAGKPPSSPGDGGAGGTGGVDTTSFRCTGNTTCRGGAPNAVYVCDVTHNPGALVATCDGDQVCSLGRCVPPACADGEVHASITGCLFYLAILDNVTSDDGKPTLIAVTNPGTSRATVTLQQRSATGMWIDSDPITVDTGSAGSFTIVKAPVEASKSNDPPPAPPPARRVVSDTPVSVMMVESDDTNNRASSSAGTMVLPAHSLGTKYMTMSYQQVDTTKIDAISGSRGGAAEISVVATQDHTSLWIYAPAQAPMAMPTPVTLEHDGDVYQLFSKHNSDTQAGTMIASDQRIAVFSGNVTTTYGQNVGGLNSPDMAMEQMLPTGSWSESYLAAVLPPQLKTCDSVFPPKVGTFWQVVAADDGAMVSFTPTAGKPLPAGLPTDAFPQSRGSAYQYWVEGTDDFLVSANVPILVTQGMDCEPTLSAAISTEAPMDVQVFTLAPNFDHMLAIVRKNDGLPIPVRLDDTDITDQFSPVANKFEVARVPVPACYGTVDRCVHTLTGAWGMSLRGMDTSSSYATTFPSWVGGALQ